LSTSPCHPSGAERPKLEVADIFRTYGDAYRATHALTPEQAAWGLPGILCPVSPEGVDTDILHAEGV